jgi:hypothetical protein
MPSWRGELEGTINTPSEGTNNYVQNKTSEISKIFQVEGDNKYPPFAQFFNFVIYTTMDTWQGCDDLGLLRQDP